MSIDIIKLSNIVDELVEEKGLSKDILINAVIEGIIIGYKKKFPDLEITANYDKKDDKINVFKKVLVVNKIEDETKEISIKKAQKIDENINIDEFINIPLNEKFGRVEISKIRQFIGQKIKQIEAEIIYNEFKDKKGTIVNGLIHKVDSFGAIVLIHDIPTFLPKSMSIPGESLFVGMHIKALIKDIYEIPKGDEKMLLERNSVDFIKKLLEFEIPEINDGLIRIEKIVRVPGYKTKVIVSSRRDSHISPVGTCIGINGTRIKSILKEIGLEKLDLIQFTNKKEDLITGALKPATINSVEIKGNIAYVNLPSDQRAIAVGKSGKNILLASQISEMQIELIDETNNNNKIENNLIEM